METTMTRIDIYHANNADDPMMLNTVRTQLEFNTFVGATIEHDGIKYSLLPYPHKLVFTEKENQNE
jgi:hypothetical protein